MNEVATNQNMKKVGEMLRVARDRKNLSLEDVYKFIKIHPKYLLALEEGNYKVFSSSVHVKGFLKVYSRLLELNVDEVLAFWRREFDESKLNKKRTIKPLENPKLLITPTSVLVFSVLSLVLIFFAYLFYQYRSYSGNPSLVVDRPKQDESVSTGSIEVTGRTDRDSSVFLNGQKVEVGPDGAFALTVDLADGLNSLNFLAINKLGKETKFARNVVKKDMDESRGNSTKSKVILEVSAKEASVALSVFLNGKEAFNGTMLLSTSQVFEASESVRLKTNNAGALRLKLNGVDIGAFGKLGEAKEQEFK